MEFCVTRKSSKLKFMFAIMSKDKTSTSKDNVKERDSGGPGAGAEEDHGTGSVPDDLASEPQRKASLMQRTDTILERIDAEGGETEQQDAGENETVPFVDIDDLPQNGQLVVGDALGTVMFNLAIFYFHM